LPLVDATASLKTRIGTFLRAMDTAHA
jgi:hypothetical protein